MKNINVFPAEGLKQELEEVVEQRTINSKTYNISGNKYRLLKSIGPVHFNNKNGELEEIDLTIRESTNYFYVDKSSYDVKIFKDFIGYQYISNNGGRIDVKLKEIGGINISELDLNIDLSIVENFPNRIIYKDVLPGIDLFLVMCGGRVQLYKVLKDSSVPTSFSWDIYEDKETKAHFISKTAGVDKNKNKIKLSNQLEEIPTTEKYKHLVFKENFEGEVTLKDKQTRIKSWSTDVTYPVVIDADVTEDIVNDNDDGREQPWFTGEYWKPDISYFKIGYTPGYSTNINGGVRFQSIGIPQGATIDDAILKLDVSYIYNNPQVKIYGDDVDDATQWSTANLPSGITKTSASKNWTATTGGINSLSITNIVQEIINRPSWNSNNDMRFAILNQGTGTYQSVWIRDYNAGQSNAAHLIVNYTAAVSTNMQINISDSWKSVDALKVNIGDSWKDVTTVKQNIGDTWKTVF